MDCCSGENKKRGKSYENNSENDAHSIFSKISSKPFLVNELSIESLKQGVRIRESRKLSFVETLNSWISQSELTIDSSSHKEVYMYIELACS